MSMKDAKSRAEGYVRGKIPELMEDNRGFDLGAMARGGVPKTVGKFTEHPIALHHWLRVLGSDVFDKVRYAYVGKDGYFLVSMPDEQEIRFNLTTGQPATEADYQALCTIFGV